jgi:hypothetical protein
LGWSKKQPPQSEGAVYFWKWSKLYSVNKRNVLAFIWWKDCLHTAPTGPSSTPAPRLGPFLLDTLANPKCANATNWDMIAGRRSLITGTLEIPPAQFCRPRRCLGSIPAGRNREAGHCEKGCGKYSAFIGDRIELRNPRHDLLFCLHMLADLQRAVRSRDIDPQTTLRIRPPQLAASVVKGQPMEFSRTCRKNAAC